jgi:hypothetical protein
MKYFMERPVVEPSNSFELACSIKHLLILNTTKSHAPWHWTKKLHHLGEVIIVLRILLVAAISRLEKEITSSHLEQHACEGPVVSSSVVLGADYYLGRSILPGLDLG